MNDFSKIDETEIGHLSTIIPEEMDVVNENEMVGDREEGDDGAESGEVKNEPDDSMDGDFDSGMASAGFGTDEDYGCYGGDDGE